MNYRRLYEKHYGIKIPPEYDVHHIDFNRENNSISNLIVLPKSLHHKLHWVRNTACFTLDRFFDFQGIDKEIDMKYERGCILAALDVYDELQIWSCRKNSEDNKIALKQFANYPDYFDYSIFR